jgi:hypothetical protein
MVEAASRRFIFLPRRRKSGETPLLLFHCYKCLITGGSKVQIDYEVYCGVDSEHKSRLANQSKAVDSSRIYGRSTGSILRILDS